VPIQRDGAFFQRLNETVRNAVSASDARDFVSQNPTLVVREIADYSAQRGLIKYRPAERALKQAIAIYHE
jgi:ectoine hydroxylase-related dioxygenase (phytanoyl-CoA dioxygenase family)